MRRLILFSLTLLLAAACVGLGLWQLRRLAARRTANHAAMASRAQPLLLPDTAGRTELLANRRAILSGELDEAHEFLLRDRLVAGVPAVLVVTPLRLAGDTAVLINRGYVPAADAIDPGTATWSEAGRQSFQGVLLPVPNRRDGEPLLHRGRETWKSLDLELMRTRLPFPIASLYLVAEAGSPEGTAHTIRGTVYPFRTDPPPLDEGPHLMYAVQWFGIAAAVAAFGVIFVWRGGPGRRIDIDDSPRGAPR